jgi:hypothetical protein
MLLLLFHCSELFLWYFLLFYRCYLGHYGTIKIRYYGVKPSETVPGTARSSGTPPAFHNSFVGLSIVNVVVILLNSHNYWTGVVIIVIYPLRPVAGLPGVTAKGGHTKMLWYHYTGTGNFNQW